MANPQDEKTARKFTRGNALGRFKMMLVMIREATGCTRRRSLRHPNLPAWAQRPLPSRSDRPGWQIIDPRTRRLI